MKTTRPQAAHARPRGLRFPVICQFVWHRLLSSAKIVAVLLGAFLSAGRAEAQEAAPADVVIYGATSGGVMAAIAAKQEGRSVMLIEPTQHLGGLLTGGLSKTDTGAEACIGGLSRRFFQLLDEHYRSPAAWVTESRSDYLQQLRRARTDDAWWFFEPSAGLNVLRGMLEETGIEPRMGCPLERVIRRDGRIAAVVVDGGERIAGRVFIDATYEGDLLAAAGVSYAVGREARSEHDEPLAGVLDVFDSSIRQPKAHFGADVDPYRTPGDPASGLLRGIHDGPMGELGAGDRKIQAYNFRICLTTDPDNRIPITRPDDYDPARYELLARWIATQPDLELASRGGIGGLLKIDRLPNHKTDINDGCPASTDYIGANWTYPEGDAATRREVIDDHVAYTKGLLYFIATDPRVPDDVRREMRRYGYPKDEYVDNGHWSPQLYIREARRLVGEHVMTQHDCRNDRTKTDSVGMGSYPLDSHHVQRVVVDGKVVNEGNFSIGPSTPYEIPYRSLLPRRNECENLLVPVAVSATHVAFGSIRMEPVFMLLGESAGVAAAMAAGDGPGGSEAGPVHEVDAAALQQRLSQRNQRLFLADLPERVRDPAPRQVVKLESLQGLVIDDAAAELEGRWQPSRASRRFVAGGYRHDQNEDKGAATARFRFELPAPGRYEVRLAYPPHRNRATNVPVTIDHVDGRTVVEVNQREAAPIDGLLLPLGEFEFGDTAVVTVSNEGTDGYVIVDAVQVLTIDE